jgi:tRNA threonylcarbamoyladenosine biosynthesis protein TsaB
MSVKILAIETATEACSAALLISEQGKDEQIISRFQLAPREHTKLILPMLDDVLNEANITLDKVDAIAFGRGPGAFTGLRIAAGVAQGIALSVEKPVIPVSTLAALALQARLHEDYDNQTIVAALDARMQEVYWGCFKSQELLGEERVTKPQLMRDDLAEISSNILAIGNGWDVYHNELSTKDITLITDVLPSAQYIAQLALDLFRQGKYVDAELAQPVYIRDNVAEKNIG